VSVIRDLLIKRFLPFLKWLPELKEGKTLRADLIAGLTVALVLIPQSMAYAQLAGLPAYYGLYAAFMPPMIASLFGSSRQLATGPVAVVSLMTAAALEPIATAGGESFVIYAILLSFMVGIFQLSLGLLRMGMLVNFLSHPVVVGFTNAAAIIIATSQLNKIFGVEVEKMEHHYETVWNTIVAAVGGTHIPTLMMALLAFFIMISLKRYNPRLPNVLIAVVITTLLAWSIEFQKLQFVPAEQIASSSIQNIVQEQLQMRKHLAAFDTEITTADQNYKHILAQYGAGDLAVLEAKFVVENLKLQRDILRNDLKQAFKQLQSKPLYFIAAEQAEIIYPLDDKHIRQQAGQLHTADDMPDAATDLVWRVKRIDEQGNLLLHTGGAVVGTVPSGLPSFQLPHFDLAVMLQLLSAAIVISLIGFMEAISIAKAMAARTRQRLDANQELIGQGIGNITGSLFQSYPTSGSFSRSAVNIGAGAITGFSAVVTSLVVVITLLWFTPLLYNLPQATLAAVIMMAVFGLINIQAVKHAWHANKHDGSVAIITFILTLVFAPHLDLGILAGVLLSLGLFLYRRMEPRVVFLQRISDDSAELENLASLKDGNPNDVIGILRFEGSLYFASTNFFEEKVQELLIKRPKMRYLIVEAVSINEVDASGEEMLRSISNSLKQAGVEVLFNRVKTPIKHMLEHTGFVALHGEDKFFRHPQQAFDYVSARENLDKK
jgi:sulfate permease, SulP family